jgi:YVTN family beta-propeller protein
MYSNSLNGCGARWARGFMALFSMLSMGLATMASSAAAAPFAYVTAGSGIVAVIDTATNTVVATVPVGENAVGVAVTPDGKHVYVANVSTTRHVAVIDTATNTVVATILAGNNPFGVAITPDGTRAYVTNEVSNTVSVIDTASNTVVATVPVGGFPRGVAITPNRRRAYVTNVNSSTVSVIDTATNTVVATVPVEGGPEGVAVAPDGKHAYVADGGVLVIATATNKVVATIPIGSASGGASDGVTITPDGRHAYVADAGDNTVSVIDTASNTVVATVPVGIAPIAVAVTPDGKYVYVANDLVPTVSVIDTASNTVVATVTVAGNNTPNGVGIVPPPPGVPFLAFNAKLAIQFGSIPTKDAFGFGSNFILSSNAPAINPVTEPVTLQVGTFTTTIPPGSFKKQKDESFTFQGKIHGVGLGALIKRTGTLRYLFEAKGLGANLTGTVNTVYVTLAIGGDSGATSVTAHINP